MSPTQQEHILLCIVIIYRSISIGEFMHTNLNSMYVNTWIKDKHNEVIVCKTHIVMNTEQSLKITCNIKWVVTR